MRSKKPAETIPVVHNNTALALEDVIKLPFLGRYRNNWRQRYVDLYRSSPGHVIAVGTTFDNRMIVVSEETDQDHSRALSAFANGRSYIAE